MKKGARRQASKCEYLIGDDICRAVKENCALVLRADECRNTVKDSCCYLCTLRENCEIRCDLPEHRGKRKKPKGIPPSNEVALPSDLGVKMECGHCVYYLKPECPRGYDQDTELWRRQDPCPVFKTTEKGSRPL